MPVWSDTGHPPGPLNYIQIEDLIAFIRAPNDQTYIDPRRGAVRAEDRPDHRRGPDVHGLGRPELQAGARRDAVPGLLGGRVRHAVARSAAPVRAPAAVRGSPAASADARTRPWSSSSRRASRSRPDRRSTAPADTPFVIDFDNQDAASRTTSRSRTRPGAVEFKGDVFPGVATRDYQVPALAAGTYPFVCTVHPNMTGTLTAQ